MHTGTPQSPPHADAANWLALGRAICHHPLNVKKETPSRLSWALTAVVALAAGLAPGCGKPDFPHDVAFYNAAADAVRADTNLPPEAVLLPIEAAGIHVGQSAATVVMPYTVSDASGPVATNSFIVRFWNMAHTWEVEACYPQPTYAPPAPKDEVQRTNAVTGAPPE